jgi:hypothetical protein
LDSITAILGRLPMDVSIIFSIHLGYHWEVGGLWIFISRQAKEEAIAGSSSFRLRTRLALR